MLVVICDDFQKDADLLYTYCKKYEHDYEMQMEILMFSNAGELLQSKKSQNSGCFASRYLYGRHQWYGCCAYSAK